MFHALLATALTLTAHAAGPEAPAPEAPAPPPVVEEPAPVLRGAVVKAPRVKPRADLYTAVRGGAFFPSYERGAGAAIALSMGAEFPQGFAFGLRVQGSPYAPYNYSRVPFIAQPQMEFAYYINVAKNFDIYPAATLGVSIFAGGSSENYSMPYWYHGVGVRAKFEDKRGGHWWLAPEFGYEVALQAPSVTGSFGYTF